MIEEAVTQAEPTEDVIAALAAKEAKKQEQIAKHLATAMAGLAKLGKYYKRHGYLPQFHAIESPVAKKRPPKPRWIPDNHCATCGKAFLAPAALRCQCQPQTINKGKREPVEVA